MISYSKIGIIKSPKIEVLPTYFDFGDIPYKMVKKEFIVKNTGNDFLEIKSISTSCGCTKATIESERLMPGQQSIMTVTFDPNLMGNDLHGKIERFVYIKSNDESKPEIEIGINANIVV